MQNAQDEILNIINQHLLVIDTLKTDYIREFIINGFLMELEERNIKVQAAYILYIQSPQQNY